ncbi:Pyridoxal phosphate-dependent transferase [Amanita muscaria]
MATYQVIPYGLPVPPNTPHAILVSLPTWNDTVTCIEGEDAETRLSGYPRFFIQVAIRKLASLMERKYGLDGERCMLFPSYRVAQQCRLFVQASFAGVRVVSLLVCQEDNKNARIVECKEHTGLSMQPASENQLHIVLFPTDALPIAKLFWQFTGTGISSRFADHWLSTLPDDVVRTNGNSGSTSFQYLTNKSPGDCSVGPELTPLPDAASAKCVLRQRIAGALNVYDRQGGTYAVQENLQVGHNSHGIADVSENDVYLFPTGMCAIWNAHRLGLAIRSAEKSVCFGFVYCDTLKVLEKWGPGCHFFPEGNDYDIDQLEVILEQESARDSTKPPILALYTEFPSNPLLRSPNLPRLRALADKYDFLMVIDDTLGNFVNVDVLPYADIVVTSLSKIFSGNANVMGGSLVLNPNGHHYNALAAYMTAHYEDTYYDEDAICMEQNSRDLQQRIKIIDTNAEALCDFLRSHSVAAGAAKTVIKEVFYPKYKTPENYERCRKTISNHNASLSSSNEVGGYGGLFSITFISNAASRAFYESLDCFRAPSLGTNFTLAVLYTILAHHDELEWAAQCGVEEGLVRVSVGMENTETLLKVFEVALSTAKKAVATA